MGGGRYGYLWKDNSLAHSAKESCPSTVVVFLCICIVTPRHDMEGKLGGYHLLFFLAHITFHGGAGWLSGLELEPDLSFRLLSTNRLFAVTTDLSFQSDDPVTIVTSRSDDLMSTHWIVHFTYWDLQIPISSVYGCWKPLSFDDTFSHYILCLMQGCGEEARQICQQRVGMKVDWEMYALFDLGAVDPISSQIRHYIRIHSRQSDSFSDYLTNLLLSQGLNPYNQSPAHLDGFLHSRQTVQ